MTEEHRLNLSPATAAAAFVIVLLAGAGGTYLIVRSTSPATPHTTSTADSGSVGAESAPSLPPSGMATGSKADETSAPLKDVIVTLAPEAVARAGIEVSQVATAAAADRIRLPGAVEPNAYHQVAVTPLVGGRIVRISAQLGDRVRRGQALAQVYSPELAEA